MVNRRFRLRGNEKAPKGGPAEEAEGGEPDLGYDQDVDMHSPGDGYHHDRSSHKGKRNWIAGAIEHPGALHRELGVPEGKKIPASKLAVHKGDSPKMERQKNLAKTLKGMHK